MQVYIQKWSLVIALFFCISYPCALAPSQATHAAYQNIIATYLLPESKEKAILDTIFTGKENVYAALALAGCEFLRSKGKIVAIHPDMPQWLIKLINFHYEGFMDKVIRTFNRNRNLQRVIVNEKIKECIAKYNLTYFTTPKKYIYHLPNRPISFSDQNYLVLSEKLDILCNRCNLHYFVYHASAQERKEVETVIRYIGYGDSHLENICKLKNGKIAIIDTEPHGTVDALTILPGFDKSIHALSAKVGASIFAKECHPPHKKNSAKKRYRNIETTTHCLEDCPMCGDCNLACLLSYGPLSNDPYMSYVL